MTQGSKGCPCGDVRGLQSTCTQPLPYKSEKNWAMPQSWLLGYSLL